MRNTASPSPAAAGDPSSRVRSRPASASGSRVERALDDLGEHRARRVERSRRDRADGRPRCHVVEERFEDLVHELPLPPRIHHLFVVGLLVEPSTCCAKNLNGQPR